MSDDLYAPLKRKTEKRFRLRVGAMPALAICGVVVGGLGAYIIVAHDPMGGEPYKIVAIPEETPVAKIDPALTAPPTVQEQFSAASTEVDPALDNIGKPTVSILTPGGEDGQMIVKTVTLPGEAPSTGFVAAPDARITEKSRYGLLPKIGVDGSRASKLYARLADPADNSVASLPKIAIVIGGLGLSQSNTADAITKLPPQVTLAFAPYGAQLQAQANKAREQGHEVMLQIPMEPFDYPANDPGPQTLLSSLPRDQNAERLYWSYSRFSGYTGVLNYLGAKFTANGTIMRPILEDIRSRGLIYIDDGSSPRSTAEQLATELKMSFAKARLTLDAVPAPDKIDEALSLLEQQAREQGQAIGIASGLPVTLERIAKWSKDLSQRGIQLVPVSAIVPAQPNS